MTPGLRLSVLVALGLLLFPGAAAQANPLRARERWDEARSLAGAPWPRRVEALLAVVREAGPTDSIHRRALSAIARELRKAGHPHGAAAWEARAGDLGPERESARLSARLRQAKALRKEGDLDAAEPLLREVATLARTVRPRLADQALEMEADDALDREELARLERFAREAATESRDLAVLLAMSDRVGCLRFDEGDLSGARNALAEASRLFRASLAAEEGTALRCAKLWLDLGLRRRLGVAGSSGP